MFQSLSKGKALENLQSKLSAFKIPPLFVFECRQYAINAKKIHEKIQEMFNGRPIVVRSSAKDEDNVHQSFAGEYESVLNVSSTDISSVADAISFVIKSYSQKREANGEDEVIIQEMVVDSCMSGVVFTHDLNTGAPYYVINYDDISGLTDTVTSGGGEYSNRTLYVHRNALPDLRSDRFHSLIEAVGELESVMGSQFLDIEFALGKDYTPYLLQVRSITTQPNWNRAVSKRIDKALAGVQAFVLHRMKPTKHVYGETTVLGQMPDWNPAEMIGRAPRALAFSLYKTLITDDAWRLARKEMGYATPIGQPLMISLAGQPFIDTRLSFHSFLPDELSESISHKLVTSWVKRLRNSPELHDKIEFDVAITTFCFDIDNKMDKLIGDTLNLEEKSEFRAAHRQLAFKLLSGVGQGGIRSALHRIETLVGKQHSPGETFEGNRFLELFAMVENCILYGTVPFSILARHGFIARTILISLSSCGVFTKQEVDEIQSGIRTVASDLVKDMHELQQGKISRKGFMKQYGHLRPGTYNILSKRYDQMSGFGEEDAVSYKEEKHIPFELSVSQKTKINNLLEEEGFEGINAETLMDYIEAATVGREYSKFIFTRSVSDMLELISEFGEEHGLSREEMSHIPLNELLEINSKSTEVITEEHLRNISLVESERHNLAVSIRLPQVLFDDAGVHVIPFQVSHPNFITHRNITAACVHLKTGEANQSTLVGKIILIENADPGFDWIFSQKIAGLVTKYGGANSHMAIRCAEFGIPAAIGCGEQRFESLVRSSQLLLDCSAGLINPLH